MTVNPSPANTKTTSAKRNIDVVLEAEGVLRTSGVTETPRLEAEALLAYLLGIDRAKLIASYSRTIANTDAYRSLVRRRAAGEPFAYIIGKKEFMGFTFGVDGSTLIPRPETETLVEHVVDTLEKDATPTIVDIGTGCGCIAISLALIMLRSSLHATDICSHALSRARKNAESLGVSGRVVFHAGDLYSALPDSLKGRVNAIVSNPPYISDAEYKRLDASIRTFEPPSALRGGTDGLDVVRRIIAGASEYLTQDGILAIEIGADQSEPAETILKSARAFSEIRVIKDLAGRPRLITGKKVP
jgi:release factor glutamine methyltransferase